MNHWKETAEIVARLGAIQAAGRRAALATVVRIVGSAYRRPGAKLLIADDGATLGGVSGGCLESDVREVARVVLETGQPCLRHYNTADESILWGLGLGCDGQVDVLVQPVIPGPLENLLPRLGELFSGDAPFALATQLPSGTVVLVESDGAAGGFSPAAGGVAADLAKHARTALAAGVSRIQETGGTRAFIEVQQPPPHLLVCGAGDDAKPLVAYAADVGFRVTLLDHRPALLDPEWFPQASRRYVARPEDPDLVLPAVRRSLAVVKTHSLDLDREWVRRLLAAGLPYIGVLGPRARTEAILREVSGTPRGAAEAVSRSGEVGAAAERVFAPVGLDLGADGPRQVAVSIVAELLAFIAHRQPRHLSERREAIHVE